MRKVIAISGAVLVAGLVSSAAMAGEKSTETTVKLASLNVEKTSEPAKDIKEQSTARSAVSVKSSKKKAAKKKKSTRKKRHERLVAKINLSTQRMNVVVDGQVKHSWKISSGAKGFHTPTGSYKPYYMTSMHYSKKYNNAPMPHSIFFRGGYAVHATGSVRRLGSPASHGCIRLSPGNARKFFKLVQKYKKTGTRIKIAGSTPASRSLKTYARKKRIKRNRYSSWANMRGFGNEYSQVRYRRRAASTRRITVRRNGGYRRNSNRSVFNWQF